MPVDVVKVIEARKQGYGIVCTTCEHFWIARDAQRARCGKACGGPISGKDFPHYRGPLPNFETWCFVCGAASDYGVKVDGSLRFVGVCKEHLRLLDTVRLSGREANYTLVRSGGFVPLEAVQEPTKPTLMQAIVQTELEWAEADK